MPLVKGEKKKPEMGGLPGHFQRSLKGTIMGYGSPEMVLPTDRMNNNVQPRPMQLYTSSIYRAGKTPNDL